LTFKDLKSQLSKLQIDGIDLQVLERLRNKPFWIWNQEQHRLESSKTKGNCCFNHIVGLPRKNRHEFPLFDYEKLLYNSLLIPEFHNPLHQDFKDKHLWVKKAILQLIESFPEYNRRRSVQTVKRIRALTHKNGSF